MDYIYKHLNIKEILANHYWVEVINDEINIYQKIYIDDDNGSILTFGFYNPEEDKHVKMIGVLNWCDFNIFMEFPCVLGDANNKTYFVEDYFKNELLSQVTYYRDSTEEEIDMYRAMMKTVDFIYNEKTKKFCEIGKVGDMCVFIDKYNKFYISYLKKIIEKNNKGINELYYVDIHNKLSKLCYKYNTKNDFLDLFDSNEIK